MALLRCFLCLATVSSHGAILTSQSWQSDCIEVEGPGRSEIHCHVELSIGPEEGFADGTSGHLEETIQVKLLQVRGMGALKRGGAVVQHVQHRVKNYGSAPLNCLVSEG